MGDSGTWAAFGGQAMKLKKQVDNLRRDVEASDEEDDAKVAQQPAKVLKGDDNTDKTAEQMQGEEVPPQARIVAYSDSDEDDFNKNRWHPASGSDTDEDHRASPVDHDTATVNVKQRQLIREVPPGNKVSIGAHHAFLGFLDQHMGPPLQRFLVAPNILRILVLASLQQSQPKAAGLLERLAIMVTVPSLALRWLGKADSLAHLKHMPKVLGTVGQQLEAFAAPALAIHCIRQLMRLKIVRLPRKRKDSKSSAASQADLPRHSDGPGSSQMLSNDLSQPDVQQQQQQHNQQQHNQQLPVQQQQDSEQQQQQISQQQYSQQRPHQHLGTIHENNAEQVSDTYTLEIAEMRHRLRPSGAQAATDHFSDAELLRHAHACGLLKAHTAEEKAEAIEQAVDRLSCTLDWLSSQIFLTSAQMEQWSGLVRWQGRDAEGRPILVVRVAQACQECSSSRAEALGHAVLSHVARAVDSMLGDSEQDVDQLVAVLDAQQATTLQVTRKVNLIKQLASLLNQHYPGRLHQLYVVDLPVVLKWVVAAVKPVLHPETRAKIHVCQPRGADFPLPSSVLDFTSSAKQGSLPAGSQTPTQQQSASSQRQEASRVVRRSMSVPDMTDRLGKSPRRRKDRLEDKGSQVLGLGIKAKMRRRTSSRTMPAPPDSQLQLSGLKVIHA